MIIGTHKYEKTLFLDIVVDKSLLKETKKKGKYVRLSIPYYDYDVDLQVQGSNGEDLLQRVKISEIIKPYLKGNKDYAKPAYPEYAMEQQNPIPNGTVKRIDSEPNQPTIQVQEIK